MKTLRVLVSISALLLIGWSGYSSEAVQVRGMIDGKELRLSDDIQRKLAEESIGVLQSCTYANLHPTGEYASTIAHAKDHSFLHVKFSKPRFVALSVGKREVPSGKVNLELREVVITLPLSSGAFLVRAGKETFYFAKFDCQSLPGKTRDFTSLRELGH
jgi:hypothetical protein